MGTGGRAALGLAATAQKSKLTLDPPWSTVFLKESVILTCSGSRFTAKRYTWYHDDKALRTHTSSHRIGKADQSHAGRYRCVAPGSRQSDPVQLTISDEWLILQAPYYAVFEGDPLRLRCYGWKGAEVSGIRYYRDGAEVPQFRERSELSMEKATTRDSGRYKCTGSMRSPLIYHEKTSPEVFVSIQEIFSTPVLRASGSADPTEGNPVTLSCITQLNPQKSDTPLQSIFYKDSETVRASGSFPEYHIPAVRLEDSGSYHCVMQTMSSSVQKPSSKLTIAVKRIPVSRVSLGVHPLGGQVVEGERLVLTCSVAEGMEPFTFSWHRQGSRQALKSEIQHSQRAVYEIPVATENDTGEYYCTVTSGNTRALSPGVKVAVKVPVSPPLLTINVTGTWSTVGDMVEIRCESSRSSAPILYRFYHEGAILGSSTVSSRGPGSLALHVTSEGDAGTYSCETDNGMANSSQRSAPFHLSVLVPVSEATIVADPTGLEVRAGGSLNLSCLLESGTTPRFKWIHNNQELAMASEFGPPTAVGNTLHFWSVQLSHGGNYQCIASNQLSPQRVFQAPSEILAITVIEDASPQVAVTGTISFLCLMGVTAALVFYFKPWKKADGRFFNAQGRDPGRPAQHEAPGQRLPPRESRDPQAEEPSYGNVCPLEQESGDVVYTVVNIKKRNGDKPKGASPSDNEEYCVTYSVLADSKPTGDSAAGARAPEGGSEPRNDIYENVPHL
ncbi:Fc receptor-like protein 3 [Emydura macquarii macquarii]|uniref:Fc receptor-like protein 3 n=1 Tax=Emydura macquarii macquarii TaxID=1129001 RepID=UPI00352A5B19